MADVAPFRAIRFARPSSELTSPPYDVLTPAQRDACMARHPHNVVHLTLNDSAEAQFADDPRLSGVYGTILFDDLGRHENGPRQRNITVFADGEVDRSPCGSGTGARVALLADDGTLGADETLEHRSIVDTVFEARWLPGEARADGTATVIPEVSGTAHRTGEHRFTLDPLDSVGTGFTLR